jgi:hypothetical protein
MTKLVGNLGFLLAHLLLICGWSLLNLHLMPGLKAFDPFPFGILALVVSSESVFPAAKFCHGDSPWPNFSTFGSFGTLANTRVEHGTLEVWSPETFRTETAGCRGRDDHR